MKRTTFSIPKMGCAAEERLVRMALERQPGIVRLDADRSERQLRVIHERTLEEIAALVSGRSRAASLHYRPMSPVGIRHSTIQIDRDPSCDTVAHAMP